MILSPAYEYINVKMQLPLLQDEVDDANVNKNYHKSRPFSRVVDVCTVHVYIEPQNSTINGGYHFRDGDAMKIRSTQCPRRKYIATV